MTRFIDLNADLGEDESPKGVARDIAMMDVISSCNIACGGHAGSVRTMRLMLQAAKDKGVKAGAHPSYPDRTNFGRLTMDIAPSDLQASLKTQVRKIERIAADIGIGLSHMKVHGALYNDAQDNEKLADMLVEIARESNLPLVGMASSMLEAKAGANNVRFIAEAFVDRRYTNAARLVSRNQDGAVITGDNTRLMQSLNLAIGKPVTSDSGQDIIIKADTLCLHSDSPEALQTAIALRRTLENNGVAIRAAA